MAAAHFARVAGFFYYFLYTAFTLSQAGIVVHWFRTRTPGWRLKALINGLGSLVTTLTLLVNGVSKFLEGAWNSILVIPEFVGLFMYIRKHYRMVSAQLSLHGLPPSCGAGAA